MNPRDEEDEPDTAQELENDRATVFASLKPDINGFLWTHLPPGLTLRKAEEIACRWHEEIMNLWTEDSLL